MRVLTMSMLRRPRHGPWAWSGYVAQSVMVDICLGAGASPSQFIADELTLQDPDLPSFSVAIDVVLYFQAAGLEEKLPPLQRSDDVLERRGRHRRESCEGV